MLETIIRATMSVEVGDKLDARISDPKSANCHQDGLSTQRMGLHVPISRRAARNCTITDCGVFCSSDTHAYALGDRHDPTASVTPLLPFVSPLTVPWVYSTNLSCFIIASVTAKLVA
jgi:hypothetical protein